MLGIKLYKGKYTNKEYADLAIWCNQNNCTIEDMGEYYECVEIPAPSLDVVKQSKINELKSTRDTLEVESIEYNGKFYDYDDKSRDRIKDAQEALEGTELSIEWTTADNTDATLFYQDFKNIRRAVAMRADMLHKRYRQLRELVDIAQTVEEVNLIVWDMAIFNEETTPEETEVVEPIPNEEVVKEEEVE